MHKLHNYTMQMRTTSAGLPWQYTFTMETDKMAIEYAERHAWRLGCMMQGFMGLDLWFETTEPNARHVAFIHPPVLERCQITVDKA